MKNITLSINEAVLAKVRRFAAEHGLSVNAIVRQYLTGIAEREDRAAQARSRIRELSEGSNARIGKRTWSRDELHDR